MPPAPQRWLLLRRRRRLQPRVGTLVPCRHENRLPDPRAALRRRGDVHYPRGASAAGRRARSPGGTPAFARSHRSRRRGRLAGPCEAAAEPGKARARGGQNLRAPAGRSRPRYRILLNAVATAEGAWLARVAREWRADHIHAHWAHWTATVAMAA